MNKKFCFFTNIEIEIFLEDEILYNIKGNIDDRLLSSSNVIFNEGYFSKLVQQNVVRDFKNNEIKLNPNVANHIKEYIVDEYLNEINGVVA